MQDRHLLILAVAGILAAGAVVSQVWNATATNIAPTTVDAPPQRFDRARIAAMEARLRLEPKIVDLVHNGNTRAVDWQIGVHPDGTSRLGFAGYVCQQLRTAGLVGDTTDVRIVDIDYLTAHPGSFRDASLGHMSCADEAEIEP